MTTKLAVLISGNGSNLQAVIDAIRMKVLPAEIVAVISNRKQAFGLVRAQKAGIATHVHLLKPYRETGRDRREYDADLAGLVKEHRPDFVLLAGWMHILSSAFIDRFPYRIINLHPALPGQFPGAHAIQDAFEAFQHGEITETGVMVHLVPDEQVDAGPVIETAQVQIYSSDSLETLTNRIHAVEHPTLIRALLRLIEGDE